MSASALKLFRDPAGEAAVEKTGLAALQVEHAEALETIGALRSSLRVAADVAEAAETAMRAADKARRAAVERADRAERLLAQVTKQLERGLHRSKHRPSKLRL